MNQNKRIIFRADGNSEIGFGHVIRSLALAEMLKNDFECHFAISEPSDYFISEINNSCKNIILLERDTHIDAFMGFISNNDIVVLDNYFFDTNYQKKIKEIGCKLVCIDDLHDKHFVADLIINHGVSLVNDYSAEAYTRFCLGFEYSLLRKPFLKKSSSNKINEINTVFVCLGGGIKEDIAKVILSCLINFDFIKQIYYVAGSINGFSEDMKFFIKTNTSKIHCFENLNANQMAECMSKCHFAIVPASSISLEICGLGIGLFTGTTAENQKNILKNLVDLKLGIDLGDFQDLNFSMLEKIILNNLTTDDLNCMIKNQNLIFDGTSDVRLINVFKELSIN